ncbi:MAG: hypothetical protein ACYC67_07860 [Prosthecobacter sp.]
MNEPAKPRWGFSESVIGIGIVIFLLGVFQLGGWLLTPKTRLAVVGDQPKALNNCKQIVLCLKLYAQDADGFYPDNQRSDLQSANQVFRELFKKEIVTDERVFGCPNSVFAVDNDFGSAPKFEKALMPGECHWMLLKHQSEKAHGSTPLVIENSLNASWPPRWDVSTRAGSKRGRAWKQRTIIVGRLDGSVTVEKLLPDGTLDWHSKNNLGPDGKSWIDTLTPEQIARLSYWDIEEK